MSVTFTVAPGDVGLVTELLGAVMVSVALVRAGEAAAPWRRRKADATDATTGAAADGEARP